MPCTTESRPATFVPREIQTAIQQSLMRPDEAVLHTVALVDRDNLTYAFNPELPWYWLVVTDRQIMFLPHEAGITVAAPRLVVPLTALLGLEIGSVLLKTWMTVYADAAQATRAEAESEPWYVLAKHATNEESAGSALTERRIEFHYTTLPAVQAAIRDLIKTRPYLPPARRSAGESQPGTAAGILRLEPALRPMVKALLADGESIRAVVFAPPGGTPRGRKQRPVTGRESATPRAWRGVALTDRRVLLLTLPPPAVPDGLRYETIVTQVAPDAVRDVVILPARAGVRTIRVRVQRGGAEQVWDIDLDERMAGRWKDGVCRLENLVRRAKLPTHPEYRRFVALTGLEDPVLTNPAHYAILLKQIKEHRYYLGEHGRTVTVREAAADWHHSLYGPITAQLTARGSLNGTAADMYMRLCEYKWLASERLGADIGFDLALQAFQYWVA